MVVKLTYSCELPAPQQCDISHLIIHVHGGSGTSYVERLDPALPKPLLGLRGLLVQGGSAQTGYIGFIVDEAETSLKMSVQVFMEPGEYFFWLEPPGQQG